MLHGTMSHNTNYILKMFSGSSLDILQLLCLNSSECPDGQLALLVAKVTVAFISLLAYCAYTKQYWYRNLGIVFNDCCVAQRTNS